MSFDVYVQLVDRYSDQCFPRTVIEEAFRPYMHKVDEQLYRLTYPGGGSSDLYLDEGAKVTGSVSRLLAERRCMTGYTKSCPRSRTSICIGEAAPLSPIRRRSH